MNGTHWLTEFDEDGDPYGLVCWCDIAADHYVSGKLTFPETADDEVKIGGYVCRSERGEVSAKVAADFAATYEAVAE